MQVKIALCQLRVTADKPSNIAAAAAAVAAAAAEGAALVVLPEMWNCPYSNDSFPAYAEDFADAPSGGAPSFLALSAAAAASGVTLVGGSVPEREEGKLYNTCCVFGPDGALLAKHRRARARVRAWPGGGGRVFSCHPWLLTLLTHAGGWRRGGWVEVGTGERRSTGPLAGALCATPSLHP